MPLNDSGNGHEPGQRAALTTQDNAKSFALCPQVGSRKALIWGLFTAVSGTTAVLVFKLITTMTVLFAVLKDVYNDGRM